MKKEDMNAREVLDKIFKSESITEEEYERGINLLKSVRDYGIRENMIIKSRRALTNELLRVNSEAFAYWLLLFYYVNPTDVPGYQEQFEVYEL